MVNLKDRVIKDVFYTPNFDELHQSDEFSSWKNRIKISQKQSKETVDILWKKNDFYKIFFEKTSYKPGATFDFQKMKKRINKIDEDFNQTYANDRAYNQRSPTEFCDFYIKKPPKNYSIEYLRSNESIRLRALFRITSPETLFKIFWLPLVLKMWWREYKNTEPFYQECKKIIMREMLENDEDNFDTLVRIIAGQIRVTKKSDQPYTALLQYQIVKDQELYQNEHPEIETTLLKPTTHIPEDWAVTQWYGEVWEHEEHNLYLDWPTALTLTHKWRPIAYASFFVQEDALFINQLQRHTYTVYDKHWRGHETRDQILDTINRKDMLHDKLHFIAKKHGLTEMIIQSGQNNFRTTEYHLPIKIYDYKTGEKKVDTYEHEEKIPRLSLETAEKIYDRYAEKKNYTFSEKDKNWHLDISQ